jgi:ribosome maturation factor RimP
MKSALIDMVTEIVERAGKPEGIEPVEVELLGAGRNRVLRIYIDKPAGVTHEDCQMISEYVGTVLDVEDAVPGGAYTLQVSSPGVERKLLRPKDFERFTGSKVRLTLRQPVRDRKNWDGLLERFSGGTIRLLPDKGEALEVGLDQVEKANLKFEW